MFYEMTLQAIRKTWKGVDFYGMFRLVLVKDTREKQKYEYEKKSF